MGLRFGVFGVFQGFSSLKMIMFKNSLQKRDILMCLHILVHTSANIWVTINIEHGKKLERLGKIIVKKRNQMGYQKKRYTQINHVLISGLHLIRVTHTQVCIQAILGQTMIDVSKKVTKRQSRMMTLRFRVLISGLLIL